MNVLLPVVFSALVVKALKYLGEKNMESEGIYVEGAAIVANPIPGRDYK